MLESVDISSFIRAYQSENLSCNTTDPTYVNESQFLSFNNDINKHNSPKFYCKKDKIIQTKNDIISVCDNKCYRRIIKSENDAAIVIQRAYKFYRLRSRTKQLRSQMQEIRNYIDFYDESETDRNSGLSNTTNSNSTSGSKNSSFDKYVTDIDDTCSDSFQCMNVCDSLPLELIYGRPLDSPSKRPLRRDANCHHSKCPLYRQRVHSMDHNRPADTGMYLQRNSDFQRNQHSVVIYEEDLKKINSNLYVFHGCNNQPMVMAVNSNCPTHKAYHNDSTKLGPHNRPRNDTVNRHIQSSIDRNYTRYPDESLHLSLLRTKSKMIQAKEIIYKKRMYRIGLNIFNKNPKAGINYLSHYQYIKDHPANVAEFLLTRSGISRSSIGDYLGSIDDSLALEVTKFFLQQINMKNKEIDEALRSFIYYVHLPGESQKICHLMEQFKEAYLRQNDRIHQFKSEDTIMVLAYAIIMLQTDAHNSSIRKNNKMTLEQFITNLRGVDVNSDIDRSRLEHIYARITSNEIRTQCDHADQVRRLNGVIGGSSKPPDLVNRIRRFICYCRMSEITDDGKKNKSDVHRRELFLFNDLLLICKLCNKSRKDDVQYQCKYVMALTDIRVKLFSTANNLFGIQLLDLKTNGILLNLNAQCEQDQRKFMFDLSDCIFESLEMLTVNYSDYLSLSSPLPNNASHHRVRTCPSIIVKKYQEIETHSMPNPPQRHESLAKID